MGSESDWDSAQELQSIGVIINKMENNTREQWEHANITFFIQSASTP